MSRCSICAKVCDDQGRCPDHWFHAKNDVTHNAELEKPLPPKLQAILDFIIDGVVDGVKSNNLANPPIPPSSEAK